jgi:hypothetical protein
LKTPSVHRDTLVDNSRVEGKRVAPKELIDLKEGIFEVPEKADGELLDLSCLTPP